MAEWDLRKYYWPKERVLRWWEQGWDWESLQKKPCPHPDFKTYAEYYGEVFSKTIMFNDPRPGRSGQISEWDYWHDGEDRWLTAFAGKRWTPYHLPLYDPNTLELSPKHRHYKGSAPWTDDDFEAFIRGLMVRIEKGKKNPQQIKSDNPYSAPLLGIVVPESVIFEGTNSITFINLSSSLFGDRVTFQIRWFGDMSTFSGSSFGESINFESINFNDSTSFKETYFGKYSNFSDVIFNGRVSFEEAMFGQSVLFKNVIFNKEVLFCDTVFAGFTNFSASNGKKSRFNNADFSNVKFDYDVDFSGGEFIGKTDFRGATFHGLAKFYDAELSEETYFTLDDAHWPLPPKPKRRIAKTLSRLRHRIRGIRGSHESTTKVPEPETPSIHFVEYEKAFCRLKKIQQGHEARTAEHFFYKLELKARMRRSDIRRTEKLAAGAYGLFSDYGESIGLPLFWLLVSFLIATAITCCAALPFWQDFAPDNLGFAATAAWHNLVPGGFIKDVFQGCHDEACRSYRYSEWSDHLLSRWGFSLYFVTGLFAACNLALWFLFGLALKRRFQIK